MFQKIILDKYIESNIDKVHSAYERYVLFFHNAERQTYLRQCKEEQFQEGFLRELFVNVLNYKLFPDPNYNLITEKKNETDSKKADGAILIDGDVRGVIELKDTHTTDLKRVESQAFGYKYQRPNANYVITSNFEKLRFYIDNAVKFIEWNLFTLNEEQFSVLWLCLAYENIVDDLPKKLKTETISREDKITKEFYEQYKQFKDALFNDLIANNLDCDKLKLFTCSQKILDRLVFILFAEDCGLLPPNTIQKIIREWKNFDEADEYRPLYSHLRKYFSYLDSGGKGRNQNIFGYNGGLFQPDKFLDNLKISDQILLNRLTKLSDYDYRSEVNVDILGHIFENSLAEIEKLKYELSGIEGYELRETNKRKKDGIFYTPRYITSYIVENTLGKLCAEKKAELGLDKEELFIRIEPNGKANNKSNGKKQKKVTSNPILEKLDEYRQWLLSLSVCDPACGSGAFLNAALDFLKEEHLFIDRVTAQILGHSIVFSEYEISILENNLFGVDINEESVEITKLALWLRTAKPNHKLNFLDANIKCGNSLISDPKIDPDKAFDWRQEFPHIFKNGGFDVVIGNPPYVDSETMVKAGLIEQRNYLSQKMQYTKGNWDLYIAFLECAFELLKSGGLMSMITSDKWLVKPYGDAIRAGMFKKIVFLTDCGREVFADALVDAVIVGIDTRDSAEILTARMRCNEITIFGRTDKSEIPLPYHLDWLLSGAIDFIKRIQLIKSTIGDIAGISCENACATSDCYKLKPFIEDRKFLANNDLKIINTGTISKYIPLWGIVNMTYLKDKYEKPVVDKCKFLEHFANSYSQKSIRPKLLIKGITLLDVCLDDKGIIIPGKSTMIILDEKNDITKLRAVMVLLNSKFVIYYIGKKYRGATYNQGVTFTKEMILNLPCPKKFNKYINQFAKLSTKREKITPQLIGERIKFSHRIQDNLQGTPITDTLKRFDDLDFTQFVNELTKQKIHIPIKRQNEWEKFFNHSQSKCRNITKQINNIDSEIDQLVYELYGLTEEEIKIIEG
ncbi:MAG: N-6 DNA methylase [Planctomycetaceae bacterium]|jgi:type I restriction-modification system DNA methylase subunit|nr:N-6 DNA methylase [Planctomycetaceae bacterium]